MPMSNTASHDNHEEINSWVSFSFLYEYGALLGGLGCQSSAKKLLMKNLILDLQQRRLHEAQDEYDQEQEILKEEFDTERWIYKD